MNMGNVWRIAWVPRVVAVLLAIGGTFWGLLLLGAFGITALIPVPFGVGYLVTVGYYARGIWTPSCGYRYLIWSASILVQGVWLALAVVPAIAQFAAGGRFNEPLLPICWWAFATVASVAALLCESDRQCG